MKKIFAILFVAASLSACVSEGNNVLKDQTQANIESKVPVGASKAQVSAALGDPKETTFTDGGNEIWKYEYINASSNASNFVPIVNIFSSGMTGKKHTLVILFDNAGKVVRHSYAVSDYMTKTGILGDK